MRTGIDTFMHEEHSPPAPALKKIDLTIARLRLLLADVTAREAAIEELADIHEKLLDVEFMTVVLPP